MKCRLISIAPVAVLLPVIALLSVVSPALAAGGDTLLAQFVRPVDVVPNEDDIGEGYKTPEVQRPLPRAPWWDVIDILALVAALGLSIWIVLGRRSRNWLVALGIASLAYFGFYREGCVCPIGAIQNVAVAFTVSAYSIPYVVIVFFFLPLILALLFGRVFCGGVCPFGALQDLVLLKPVTVPRRLDKSLGLLKYVYLCVALWFVVGPTDSPDFIICRYDPFVGFFRGTGPGHILVYGGALLLLGVFVGRPYCRYLCPYGALLSVLSRVAPRGVTITPDKELDCGLCAEACPYGAIEEMRAVRSACLFCARCYAACPREPVNWPEDESAESTPASQQPSR